MESDRSAELRSELEAWWPLVLRICSGTLGVGIMFWQTVVENADRPYLILAALTMMGYPVAGWLAEKLDR